MQEYDNVASLVVEQLVHADVVLATYEVLAGEVSRQHLGVCLILVSLT